ncbi:hypothetical protein DFJ74DRAFT_296459 [Hyaloraphidium curvatum]|nr:hypothetical protein DFJ74DRAFT_296459 [Hyaloraphidium curvatum]
MPQLEMSSPPLDSLLGPAAFLACFPAPPPVRTPRGLPATFAAGFADPPDAAALRAQRPLDAKSTLDALQTLDPSLKLGVDMYMRSRPMLASVWSRLVFQDAPQIFLFLLVYPFNDRMFVTRGLATATVAFVFNIAWWTWVTHGTMQWWGAFADRWVESAELPSEVETALSDVPKPLTAPNEAGVLAGIVRYMQLIRDQNPNGITSGMMEHEPGCEDSCPCVACTKELLRSASLTSALVNVSFLVLGLVTWLPLRNWTSIVTLGGLVWTTPWSGTLASVALVMSTAYVAGSCFRPTTVFNSPMLDLELRLRTRAVSIALNDLKARLRRALLEGHDDAAEPPSLTSAPYIALHARLLSEWRDNFTFSGSLGYLTRSLFLGDAVAIVVNAAGASCLPAFYVASVGLLLYIAILGLFSTAWVNRQCDAVASAYRSAVLELTALADEAATAPPAVLSSIKSHRSLLKRFADLDGARARFIGIPVTTDVIRALATTVVTLAVALWSVFRSLGVGITIQTVWPAVA